MLNLTSYTASEAREKLFTLIRSAGRGSNAYEFRLRGSDPVVLINKDELEGWFETFDILSNPDEAKALRKAMKSKKFISHEQVLKELGLKNEDLL